MANSGTTTINFGAAPGSNEASVVVADTNILATSMASAWITAQASSNHSITDHAYAAALCGISTGAPTVGTGFTIYARSPHKLTGIFNLNWVWV
jgi:hypothetical protein